MARFEHHISMSFFLIVYYYHDLRSFLNFAKWLLWKVAFTKSDLIYKLFIMCSVVGNYICWHSNCKCPTHFIKASKMNTCFDIEYANLKNNEMYDIQWQLAIYCVEKVFGKNQYKYVWVWWVAFRQISLLLTICYTSMYTSSCSRIESIINFHLYSRK